jgi:predicted nucleic acid-binding protein
MHAIDSSILIAALRDQERCHEACNALLSSSSFAIYDHGLTETFNTLTGGKLLPRVTAATAARAIRSIIQDDVIVLHLPLEARLAAFDEAEARGVRGGAIYDYLHLVAARLHGMEKIHTLNTSHFQSFWRPGDPVIAHP